MAFAHPGITANGRIQYAPTMTVAETMIKANLSEMDNYTLILEMIRG